MSQLRIIPRLDIKGPNLVKGIHLEGIRVVGKPEEAARRYYEDGADELIYMDVVATLYGRNNLLEIVKKTAENIFIPLTVGGGIRTIEDIRKFLRAGADKVSINSAAVANPDLIREASHLFGSQCIVVSIEAKKIGDNAWEVYTESGREKSGKDAVEWAKEACRLGAGEILLTSIDHEGTEKGYEIELVEKMTEAVPVPVIACGGGGTLEHMSTVVRKGRVDAVSMASVLHYNRLTIREIKKHLNSNFENVRMDIYEL